MDTVVASSLTLLVLVGIYLYTLFLPASPANRPCLHRHIKAIVSVLALSCAAAEFVHARFFPHGLLEWLVWAATPAIAAGTAGRRPFVYLFVSSVMAALAMVIRNSNSVNSIVNPLLVFIEVVIVVNVLGTFFLLPLLAVWEHRRKSPKYIS